MTEFDIASLIARMESNQRQDHQDVMDRFDDMRDRMESQATRITALEGTYRIVRWLAAAVVGALISSISALINGHNR